MVTMTATQWYIMCGATFIAMVAMPVLSDYVFFVIDNESSWLRASIGAAIIGGAFLAIVSRIIGL